METNGTAAVVRLDGTGSPPLLALQEVHTYLAGSHVLQGVTFDVTAGETTVLLGRNGAGKSTTLRTILGLWQPARGSISLDVSANSRDSVGAEPRLCPRRIELAGMPAHRIARHGIGFVPEDREVFTVLTIAENLRLAQRAGASDRNAVEHVYHLFPDLETARGRSAGALSGGQQQMLAIGRALVNRNRILLIDEPTKGLAPVIVQQLQDIFRSLREQGETILLVEQNLAFAQAVGNRYFILDEGRIVHGGRMDELAQQPEILRRYIGV